MNPAWIIRSESTFMQKNVPLFLQRFFITCFKEDSCIEYFINKPASTDTVSSSLVFCYNAMAKDLHVSRFHPELYLQANSKYLSAACFYLLIHHCANTFSLDDTCRISLETVPKVCEDFYSRLGDFKFQIHKNGLGNVVELSSDLVRLPVDTSMIKTHVFGESEIPFLK